MACSLTLLDCAFGCSLNSLSDRWEVGGATIEAYEDDTLSTTQKMKKAMSTVEQKTAKKRKMHDAKEAT